LEALRIEKVAIVGASMGGATAYNFAARFPQRVTRLVVVDVSPSLGASTNTEPAAIAPALVQDRFESFHDALTTRASIYRRPNDPYVRETIERNVMLLGDGSLSWRYDLHGVLSSFGSAQDHDQQWRLLEQITAPTLLIRGAESKLFTPEHGKRMCRTIPDATLVEIPDAGHPVPIDQPARFLSTLLPFLLHD
jgi:pimeloyl-ACP methyl ester carboxylesterase